MNWSDILLKECSYQRDTPLCLLIVSANSRRINGVFYIEVTMILCYAFLCKQLASLFPHNISIISSLCYVFLIFFFLDMQAINLGLPFLRF